MTEEQLTVYLQENPGALRFMQTLWDKYRSFGRFSGTIHLVLTTSEAEFLNGLMKKHYQEGDEVHLSAVKFLRAFDRTRFQGADFLRVCEIFFGKVLETKKEEQVDLLKQKQEFFETLRERYRQCKVGEWLKVLTEGGSTAGSEYLSALYRRNERNVEEYIKYLAKIDELLSAGFHTSLPILAAEATKNPHALDADQELYRLLIYFLSYRYGCRVPQNREATQRLLHQAGIRQDVGTRTIMTYGLKAVGRSGSKGWEQFFRNGEPLVLALKNLEDVVELQAVFGRVPVFTFENPAVFTRIIEQEPSAPCLCTSGQFHTLDHYFIKILLQDPLQKLYYSGDYDPEGLLIADKLWALYPDQVELMGYETDLYNRSLSDQPVSAKRLRQLENLKNPLLRELGEEIKVKQKAGYQEYVVDSLAEKVGLWTSSAEDREVKMTAVPY